MDKKTYYKYNKTIKMVEKLSTKGNIFPLFGHKIYFYLFKFLIEIIFDKNNLIVSPAYSHHGNKESCLFKNILYKIKLCLFWTNYVSASVF